MVIAKNGGLNILMGKSNSRVRGVAFHVVFDAEDDDGTRSSMRGTGRVENKGRNGEIQALFCL